ncbi:MAG: FAD binding domain-containing protein [Candidatus Bathyarchaeia archaeon]
MATLPPIEYMSPRTLSEAVSLLEAYGDRARILAGGTDLLVLMKDRALTPQYLVDITRIPNLDGITMNGEKSLRIGALTHVRTIEKSPVIKDKFTSLAEAAGHFGTVQIRHMATIAGNICRASPAADLAPPLLTFDTSVKLVNAKDERIVPLTEFFTGPARSVIKPNELLTEVYCAGNGNRRSKFLKLGRTFEDLAKVSVAVAINLEEGVSRQVRIALGAVAPQPIRATTAESTLEGQAPTKDLIRTAAQTAAEETKPITDLRSTADYRRKVSRVLVERALTQITRAGG